MDNNRNIQNILDVIDEVAQDYIDCYDSLVDPDQFEFFVLYVYLGYPDMKGCAMDFRDGLSIAMGHKVISVIGEGRTATLYTEEPMIAYHDLILDIDSIFMNVCSCIDQWRDKSPNY